MQTQHLEVLTLGLPSGYEIEHLARVFYPSAAVHKSRSTKGALIYARVGSRRMAAGLRMNGRTVVATAPRPVPNTGEETAHLKLALARLLYDLLREFTGLRPPWGMLTGVRPLRLFRKAFAQGGEPAARQRLLCEYDVSPEKYALVREIQQRQAPMLQRLSPKGYSLYVSIPFCPSRCAYCSFVSRTMERDAALIAPYLAKLELELRQSAKIARECNLKLETLYIGGGTPTALNTAQLERLLAVVAENFDTAGAMEYTVEAGRPDCTGADKLQLLREYGVTRVSINPQTMCDEVLREIGRRHTAQDIRRCFADARQAGHACINMDLIAGLPKDTPESFLNTLDEVIAMRPENITVHTLTLKRASNLVVDNEKTNSAPGVMLAAAAPRLRAAGYRPYYLYRQKCTIDNLENIGWALADTEGLYNISIMEEAGTILAVGAGAATKLVWDGGSEIKRSYNHKFPVDYIANIQRILDTKQGVNVFYASHMDSETIGGGGAD